MVYRFWENAVEQPIPIIKKQISFPLGDIAAKLKSNSACTVQGLLLFLNRDSTWDSQAEQPKLLCVGSHIEGPPNQLLFQ
jgi:hypothetical protein